MYLKKKKKKKNHKFVEKKNEMIKDFLFVRETLNNLHFVLYNSFFLFYFYFYCGCIYCDG